MAKLAATTFHGLSTILANCNAAESQPVVIGNNTTAEWHGNEILVRLHGNLIATLFANNKVEATLAGWPTKTTIDRVNQLLHDHDMRVRVERGTPIVSWFHEGRQWRRPFKASDWIVAGA